ncbi:AAA family ATPase [Pseudomonas sp. CG7]|uniref:AAA family ATPase n=1 Tax=Pseudomonas sp. CG7 TaxID=191007 RepID=UPI00203420E2|nr:AAA family ATPase [Pseudomonas sp. CG7]MCM2458948.1 AAA family ATPase [Pseudomonas sp. CG7]
MDIYICSRFFVGAPSDVPYPHLLLARDSWNDYSYYTLFDAELRVSEDYKVHLDELKIMKDGQPEGIENRPFQDLSPGALISKIHLDSICSLSSKKKYYDTLATLSMELAHDVLKTLNDASFLLDIKLRFQEQPCFQISLLRDFTARELLDEAGIVFGAEQQLISAFTAKILLEGASAPHEFYFDFYSKLGAPRRIQSIVGLNGVGKTQVMARLAMLMSRFSKQAIKEKRSALQGDDILNPVPSIYGVVAVSFSAFDEFERPTQLQGEKFKYSYCGLQSTRGRLKNKEDLLEEIKATLASLSIEKRELLKKVLGNLVRVDDLETFIDEPENNESMYERLSAGQRLALNCVFHILSKIDRRTLILFDEPELHLHPQLLTGLLNTLSEILESQDSFAIIATHSPLVIQQLPMECVHVLRRDRMTPMVLKPTFQTFGESLSELTKFVFSSTEADRDYRSILDRMYAEANHDIEAVRAIFSNQLSLSADIYLESLQEVRTAPE